MAIRLSGLTSGMDTDAIVQELVSAYSLKTQKYEKASTKLTWKQDAWKTLNTKIYSLYTSASNMRLSSAYNLRKVTVSDNTKATITATSEAVKGSQKLNILQTAQSGYITGGILGKDVASDTKLSELGYTATEGKIEVKKNDGTTAEVKITKDMTVNDVVASLKETGLNVNFDAANRRFFISSKESGVENDFTISGMDANGEKALKTLGLDVALTTTDEKGQTVFTASAKSYQDAYEKYYKKATDIDGDGTIGVEDVKAYISSQVEKYDELLGKRNVQAATYEKNKATYENLSSEYKRLQEIYGDKDNQEIQEKLDAMDRDALATDLTNATTKYLGVKDKLDALDTTASDYEDQKKTLDEQLAAAEEEMNQASKKKDEYDDMKNYLEYPEKIETAKNVYEAAAVERDALTKQMAALDVDDFIKARGEKKDGVYENQTLMEREIYEMAEHAVRANEILTDTTGVYSKGNGLKIDASDAVIKLNGVEYTSATNSFSINGLSITANAVTGDGDANAVQVTTSVDTQGIYDKIKDFLTEYNNVINEMCKLYNAESAKDYEPLTDEEKEAMSDEQIEKWENKIKTSLLRRDTTLNSVMSGMVNAMAQVVEVNGEKLSLSTFGIGTLGYLNAAENENYAYHIDGDPDDENVADQEDELMAAIENDPERVMELMKGVISNLYSAIDDKMKSTELSSAYKVYNDKEMDKQQKSYAETIAKWEDKISDKEDYYYKKFSQMEVALSKLQNQTSSISSLLGS